MLIRIDGTMSYSDAVHIWQQTFTVPSNYTYFVGILFISIQ